MGNTKKWSAVEVAAALRQRVVDNLFTNRRVTEREIQEWYPASRHTIRFALSMLSAEGLVTSHHGVGWSANDPEFDGTFELAASLFEMRPRRLWPALMKELLAYRARSLTAGIEALTVSGVRPSNAARAELTSLYRESWAEQILDREEWFFAELVTSEGTLVERLAAHQLRRALERVRKLMPQAPEPQSNYQLFTALYEAIEAGDRPLVLRLSELAVPSRHPIYLRMANEAAQWDEHADSAAH